MLERSNSKATNSQRRLIEFKTEWQSLLDAQFHKKAPKFEEHYSDVVGQAVLNNKGHDSHFLGEAKLLAAHA